MLLTDVEKGIRGVMNSENVTLSELARRMGCTRQTIYSAFSRKILNQLIIDIANCMGYDIEIQFVKRK